MRDLAAGRFAWLVLTSPGDGRDARRPARRPGEVRARVAAIGDGTAAAFERWAGREPDLRPRDVHDRGPGARLPARRGPRALPARRHRARGSGGRARREGLDADPRRRVPDDVSRARCRPTRAPPSRAGEVDAVTFTSASTVRGFVGALGEVRGAPKVVCIGPVTAKEARAHGFTVHAVAEPHTTDGLVAALERVFTPGQTS